MSANDRQVGGDHYRRSAMQPWDVMQDQFTPEEFRGFLRGTALKYQLRYRYKGGVLDIQKAIHTLEKLAEFEEGEKRRAETAAGVWEGDT